VPTVVVAAIIGDTVGYDVGRQLGPRILESRRLERHRRRLEAARALLARRGGSAVFLGRFVAFFRAVMPALAGASRMPYPRFLAFNAAGALSWGLGAVLLGDPAGNSYARIENVIGRDVASVAVAVITIAGLVTWGVHRHRANDSTGE
jgi:membrane-associated protein